VVKQLGAPRLHLRICDSTNERARRLAMMGAPHGTLVTTGEQTAGRGRQGRTWVAPAGSALLCSIVLREPPPLLSLIAGVAVCDAIEAPFLTHGARRAPVNPRVKWPNDVVVEMPALAKLAGILVEGRPQDGWGVLGIGINVAVHSEQLPEDLRVRAASLERPASAIEPLLAALLDTLARRIAQPTKDLLSDWGALDALRGRDVGWTDGHGRAEGVDGEGRLLVGLDDGTTAALSAGEVHLASVG
jgi:BirA family transcriptional regulator, biotin operon repressor / biotin---[acetyl-CoA-carboxylase] ligase